MNIKGKNIITDGQDLAEKAEGYKAEGVEKVTVTVNTMDHTRYQRSNGGRHLQPVIDGINKAVGAGLKIRLDVSLKKGFNENEVLDFLQLILQHDYEVVFMPTISYDFLRSKLPSLRKADGGSEGLDMYTYPGARGKIGFVRN